AINLPNNSTPDCTQDHPAGVCPTPVAGMPYTGDPFATMYPVPSVTTAGTSYTDANGITHYTPGLYSNLTVNTTGAAGFDPGGYEFTGAFRINGGASVCGGGTGVFSGSTMTSCTYSSGVTFYLTGNGSLSVNGTSNTQMFAPNSGTYQGLLFYQDPLDT